MKREDAIKLLVEHRQEFTRFGVKSLALFGSVVRDESQPGGDVDVLVEFEGLARMTGAMMTLEQIRVAGYRALLQELGPVNLVRFLQQFETGYGDYTQERHDWLDQYTIEEITQEIQRNRDTR